MTISPKIGDMLIKTTKSNDIDEALHKILSEYLSLKLKNLDDIIEKYQHKWNMNFEEFKKSVENNSLPNAYSFEVEKDFWEWEEAITLKHHYEEIINRWI